MANELIVNASLPEIRIALLENGEIQDLLIERASGKGIVGNIYKGRVTRVLPGMQAAFVDIGLEKAAFLYVDDVFVHPEVWEETEQPSESETEFKPEQQLQPAAEENIPAESPSAEPEMATANAERQATEENIVEAADDLTAAEVEEAWISDETFDDEDENPDDETPAQMGPDRNDGGERDSSEGGSREERPEGTIAPEVREGLDKSESAGVEAANPVGEQAPAVDAPESGSSSEDRYSRGRHRRRRRGRRGGRKSEGNRDQQPAVQQNENPVPNQLETQYQDDIGNQSDRAALSVEGGGPDLSSRPAETGVSPLPQSGKRDHREEFRSQRSRDRRIKPKQSQRGIRGQVNIQDLLKEGQEILVQVAKDPIATKGARLTCHISLPGRHLVCMPTIDHVGVSRRIDRDDERRRLRDLVEQNRPKNLGFIVRTASGKQQSEKRIKQDIDYLTNLWTEIREKSSQVTAPALVYEDLNSVLRAIRDWVTEEIDKVIVDSRYYYNDILRFVSHFMPSLKQKIELYHGDIPIFDAYGISSELSRALERKVWLKSGGYIVIDQAEALVAIDVNTGRYVGKKNLEDTILKTNLEAVQEIAYQLRLRNCGGIIILDLIDMEKEENRQRVYRALEDALKKDRARPSILKISELGLVEMTRKRTRDTITRTLCESCSHCEGKGFIKSKQTVAYEVLREVEREGIHRNITKILVQAHADVIDILAIDERETLDQLERRYRKPVYLQAVMDFHPEQFEVSGEINEKIQKPWEEPAGERGSRNDRESGGRHHRSSGRRTESPIRPRIQPRPQPLINERTNLAADVEESRPAEGLGNSVARLNQSVSSDAARSDEGEATPIGNSAVGNTNESSSPTAVAPSSDGFYDEEDRLAFLRAQAAQDAALAGLRTTNAPGRMARPGSQEMRGGSGGFRGRRSRRNAGKFRRDASPRGPKHYGGSRGGGTGFPSSGHGGPADSGESSSSSTPGESTPAGGGGQSGGESSDNLSPSI